MSAPIDPITRSVVQHRLSSIVKEMGEAMLRTTYSQILNSSRDFSLAICDRIDRLSRRGWPGNLIVRSRAVIFENGAGREAVRFLQSR